MSPVRTVFPVISVFLVASLLMGGSALAQSKDDVNDALSRVDNAKRELEAARSEAESARGEASAARGEAAEARDDRAFVNTDLDAAIDRYSEVNGELERLTVELGRLSDRVLEYEAEVRRLRLEVRNRAVQAYMSGGNDSIDAFFGADSFHEVATGQELLRQASSRDISAIDRFEVTRREMDRVKDQFAEEQDRVTDLRLEADLAVGQLNLLFEAADADVGEADAGVAAADARVAAAESQISSFDTRLGRAQGEYTDAVQRFEDEVRRRAATLGVGQWAALVSRYFPESRVNEALRVMRCESSGNPNAYNPSSQTAGLFQFRPNTFRWSSAQAGFGGASPYNPEANVASAAFLVKYSIRTGHPGGAWGHWTCKP